MDLTKLIFNILLTGAALLCAGSLGEMVLDLQKKAAHDTAAGIFSISTWNKQLTENRDINAHLNTAKKHPKRNITKEKIINEP